MADPYTKHLSIPDIYAATRPVRGRVVAVLRLRMEDRFLRLIVPHSRAFRRGDIVEILCTAEPKATPGGEVNSVAYLALVEIEQGGMVLVGQRLLLKGTGGEREAGTVAGFDETHMPNHMNIVLQVPERATGEEAGWRLDQEVTFALPEVKSS